MMVSEVGRMMSGSSSLAVGVDVEFLPLFGLEAVVRDDRAFLGEPFRHVLFLGQETHGDEEGEIGVDVALLLEEAVEPPLHLFPDRVAVGLDDHAAADVRVVGQAGVPDDVQVPLGVVDFAGGDDFGHDGPSGEDDTAAIQSPVDEIIGRDA